MFTTKTVFIIIVAICVMVFLVAVYKILGKGKKGSKKEKKAKKPKKQKDESKSALKLDNLSAKPTKINKEKLKKVESESAKIEPAFTKEELDKEIEEKLKIEAKKAKEGSQQQFVFPNFNSNSFKFQPTQIKMPNDQNDNDFVPKIVKNEPTQTKVPVEAKQEDKDFVQLLKDRGIVKKEQSFGESLMVKEAIDTPVSKNEMKKKRQKWI